MARRAQTSAEYLFIIVSVIVFVVLVFMLLRGNLLPQVMAKATKSLGTSLDNSRPYLFYDTFDAGANQWTPAGGAWAYKDQAFVQSANDVSFKVAYAGHPDWYNYAFEAQVRASPPFSSWVAGIGARFDPGTMERYACYENVGDSSVHLLRFHDAVSAPEDLDSGVVAAIDSNWHALGLVVSGSEISCFYDGLQVASYPDPAPLVGGIVTLESYNVPVSFDDVKVWPQAGPVPSYSYVPTPSPTPTPGPSATPLPPGIYYLTASATTSTADVTWSTDVPADAKVEYGTTASYGLNGSLNSSADVNHNQTLSNLLPNRVYHYRAWSCSGGSCAHSVDALFSTAAGTGTPVPSGEPTPPPAPFISQPQIAFTADNGNNPPYPCTWNTSISWTTDIASDAKVGMDNLPSSPIVWQNTTLNSTLTANHVVEGLAVPSNIQIAYTVWSCNQGACTQFEVLPSYLSAYVPISSCGFGGGGGGSPLMWQILKG